MKITKIAFNIININQIIFLYKKKKKYILHIIVWFLLQLPVLIWKTINYTLVKHKFLNLIK